MGHRLVFSLAALAIPTAMAWSAELLPMKLEPSQPPKPKTASDRLVDKVIPAYGVRDNSPYRLSSRMNELYTQVQIFASHVDALVMSNRLAMAEDSWEFAKDEKFPKAARPILVTATLLPQQELLMELIAQVSLFEEQTPLPNHYERWHINTAYRDLFRAGEHLALGLGDPRFANLRDLHRAWKDYYHRLIQAQVVQIIADLVAADTNLKRAPNLDDLMQTAITQTTPIPWPVMSLDLEADPYAPVFLPAIPRWSEVSEEGRERFIARFGIPGQAVPAAFPVADAVVVPAPVENEAGELSEPMELPSELPAEEGPADESGDQNSPAEASEGPVALEPEVEAEEAAEPEMTEDPAPEAASEAPVEELEIELPDLD